MEYVSKDQSARFRAFECGKLLTRMGFGIQEIVSTINFPDTSTRESVEVDFNNWNGHTGLPTTRDADAPTHPEGAHFLVSVSGLSSDGTTLERHNPGHSAKPSDPIRPVAGIPQITDFDVAFNNFINGLQKIIDKKTIGDKVGFMPGGKFIRVYTENTRGGAGRSCYCFVAKDNGSNKEMGAWTKGDVFMSGGWKAPAKHARGNIFDPHNGLEKCGPYGVAYLNQATPGID